MFNLKTILMALVGSGKRPQWPRSKEWVCGC